MKKPSASKPKAGAPSKKRAAGVGPKGGRPPFAPTNEQREKVEILLAGGQSEIDIARVIGVARSTLREHFHEELNSGRAKRRGEVILAQYRTAMAGNASAQERFLKRSAEPTLEQMMQPSAQKPVKQPKLGKKEQAIADAHNPDTASPLGELMAQRMSGLPN